MNYWAKRLLGLIPLFFGIIFISFTVIHLAPGGPVDFKSDLNPKMSAQARDRMQALYGLNKPALVQFADWARRASLFDFGHSFSDGEKVTEKISKAIPVTLFLNGLALFFIFFIGIPIGMFGAVKKDSRPDHFFTVFTMAGFSMPTFWLSLVVMSFFGVRLHLLPVSGLFSFNFEDMTLSEKAADLARHLALPVFVSTVTGLAGISRFMRSSMLEVLRENYICTARAKGLPESKVLYGHALKNALLPVITILGLSVPGLLGGSVVFESIFSIPGMGRLFFNSVFSRDYPVIMGILVLGAVLTLIGNFLADLAYRFVDPRIRLK